MVVNGAPVIPECSVPLGGQHAPLMLPLAVDVGDGQRFPGRHQCVERCHRKNSQATQTGLSRLGSTAQQDLKQSSKEAQ